MAQWFEGPITHPSPVVTPTGEFQNNLVSAEKVQCLDVGNFVELLVILVPRAQTIAVRRTEFNATVQVNGHFQ